MKAFDTPLALDISAGRPALAQAAETRRDRAETTPAILKAAIPEAAAGATARVGPAVAAELTAVAGPVVAAEPIMAVAPAAGAEAIAAEGLAVAAELAAAATTVVFQIHLRTLLPILEAMAAAARRSIFSIRLRAIPVIRRRTFRLRTIIRQAAVQAHRAPPMCPSPHR
jgi:hypothetical protein